MRVSSLDRLVSRIASPDPAERVEALWELGYRYPWASARPRGPQRRRTFARMVAVLRDDPVEGPRVGAAHVLRTWFGERDFDPTPHLIRALKDDPSGAVRGEAAEGLGCRLGSTDRVRAALEAGLSDPDPRPRFWSLYAVGSLDLLELRPRVAAMVDDPAQAEAWWTVGAEARDVLTYWDTGIWPDRAPDGRRVTEDPVGS